MTPRAYRNVVRRSVDDIWLVLRLETSLRPYLVRRYSEHVSIDRGPIQSGSRNHKLSTVPGTRGWQRKTTISAVRPIIHNSS